MNLWNYYRVCLCEQDTWLLTSDFKKENLLVIVEGKTQFEIWDEFVTSNFTGKEHCVKLRMENFYPLSNSFHFWKGMAHFLQNTES